MSGRLSRLREKMDEHGFAGFLVGCPIEDTFHIAGMNRRYLSGFTGSMGWLMITLESQFIAVDFRYFEQAEKESPDFTLFPTTGGLDRWLPSLAGDAGLSGKKIGFEKGDLSLASANAVQTALESIPQAERPKVIGGPPLVAQLREFKEPEEIETLQRAVDVGDAAFQHAADQMEPGWTEKQVAWEIEKYARENGAEFMSFPSIVAAGPRGAMPHAMPTDYEIQAGDPVVIDMGVIVDGYCSDLTRTVVCGGKGSADFLEVYDIVHTAQLTAEELIRAGMTGEDAHMFAHSVIEEAGYGENFGHGLGHGVGLQVHEAPRLARTSDDVLADGQVVTVEPGVYLPGKFGVRIEDQCVIESGKVRPMSRAPKVLA
jgi:Xaa-Pro aminopeptidase